MTSRLDSPVWFIAGRGAVGMSIAYRLQLHDVPVCFITRDRQPNPMTMTHRVAGEDAVEWSCPTVFEPTNVTIERLLIATKAYSVSDVLGTWGGSLTPHAHVYFLQNGKNFGSGDDMADSVRCLVVVNTGFSSYRSGEHGVVQTAVAPLWVGDDVASDEPPDAAVREDLAILAAACLPVQWTPKIDEQRWLKIAVNAAINPLTVIFDCTNGQLLEDPEAIDLIRKLSEESSALFKAMELPLTCEDIHSAIQRTLDSTARNYSSMLQDMRRGTRRHELDFINLHILEAAAKHAVDVPLHRDVYDRTCRLFEQQPGDVRELT